MTRPLKLIHCISLGIRDQNTVFITSVKTNSFPFYSLCRKLCLGSNFISSTQREISELKDIKKNNTIQNSVIYYGALTSQIKGVKIFTCTTSLGGFVIQPILLQNLMSGSSIPLTLALSTIVGFFTFISPLLIHLLTKKYIVEMTYNSSTDTYTAVTLSFFLRKISVEFQMEDVVIPNNLPIFTTMFIKNQPVFIDRDSFLVVDHYIKLMGYDKPMDLKLAVPFDKLNENPLTKSKNGL